MKALSFLDKKEIEMEIFSDTKQIGTWIWLTISFDSAKSKISEFFH